MYIDTSQTCELIPGQPRCYEVEREAGPLQPHENKRLWQRLDFDEQPWEKYHEMRGGK